LKRKIKRFTLFLFLFCLLLVFLFNGSIHISDLDRQYMSGFLKEWNIKTDKDSIHQNQASQLDYIMRIQKAVVHSVRHDSIAFDSVGIVRCYFNERRGQCFDRSVLLEKFFMEAGFKIRHIYTFFKHGGGPIASSAFFKKGLSSHAMFEIKTKEGWMAVGTNSDWIGLQKDGTVLTLPEVRDRINDGSLDLKYKAEVKEPFFDEVHLKGSFKVVYGIYSRHGDFLISRPVETLMRKAGIRKSPFPDYNLRMLLYNL